MKESCAASSWKDCSFPTLAAAFIPPQAWEEIYTPEVALSRAMNQKQVLLNRIRVCDFVLTESALYLDTHPDDAQALEFYHKHLAMRQQAMEEYSKQYGTLVRTQPHSTEHWDWVDNPWPWEKGE